MDVDGTWSPQHGRNTYAHLGCAPKSTTDKIWCLHFDRSRRVPLDSVPSCANDADENVQDED